MSTSGAAGPRRGSSRVSRIFAIVVAILGAVGFVWWWQAASVVARDLVRPRNARLELDGEVPDDVSQAFRVLTPDGVELDVWVLDAQAPHPEGAVDTLFVFHGIADHKGSMLGLARRFVLAGVRTVLMDFRGHGRSSQAQVTFGVREREDVSHVLDALEERGVPVGEVGIYGPSFGGAVAIQAASVDARIGRVVTVASFASMRRIVGPYVSDTWGPIGALVPRVVIDGLVDRAGEEARFDPDAAAPVDGITRARARVLLIHSRADEIVPYEHAVEMAAACGPRCELLTLENLSHMRSMSNTPLRLASYRHLVGEEFPGDLALESRRRP